MMNVGGTPGAFLPRLQHGDAGFVHWERAKRQCRNKIMHWAGSMLSVAQLHVVNNAFPVAPRGL